MLSIHTQLTNNTNQKSFLEERLENYLERQDQLNEQIKANQVNLEEAEVRASESQVKVDAIQEKQGALQQVLSALQSRQDEEDEQISIKQIQLKETHYLHNTTRSGILTCHTRHHVSLTTMCQC